MINTLDLGIKGYRESDNVQRILLRRRQLNLIGDTVIFVEHPPVFTIGRRGRKDNLLAGKEVLKKIGAELVETDRGGDITFHGPGQLVLYPIIDLKNRKRCIQSYLGMLEGVIIDFLSRYGIKGIRKTGATGIWIDDMTKIGSIGIGISRWVTYHGLSINVNTPLHYFDMIRPCGLAFTKMTSISRVLNKEVDMGEAKIFLLQSYGKVSGVDKKEACQV